MAENGSLHELAPADLLLLQKHVKLGKKHLENCLTQEEVDTIFDWIKLDPEIEEMLSSSSLETTGHVSLAFNTILTSILGFWLGLSSLLNWKLLSSATLITVLLLSFSVGGYIGFQAIVFRRRMTQNLLDKRKFKHLEIQIVKKVNAVREKELNEVRSSLSSLLQNANVNVSPQTLADSKTDVNKLYWESISSLKETDPIRDQMEKKIRLDQKYNRDHQVFKKISKKLSQSSISNPINLKSWIQGNFNRLIIELFPTILGGASSLFVYIGGTQALTEELGHSPWIDFLEKPSVKIAELVLVWFITLYFGFSYFWMNRKAFKREQEMAKTDAELIEEEKRLDSLSTRLLNIKEYTRTLEMVN